MRLRVVLRPEASRDAEEARDYLDDQRAGLGQVFVDRLQEVLARIGVLPEMYAVVWRNVRTARLRQFTYIVYYRLVEDEVEVLAVLHGSRDYAGWKSRVQETEPPNERVDQSGG